MERKFEEIMELIDGLHPILEYDRFMYFLKKKVSMCDKIFDEFEVEDVRRDSRREGYTEGYEQARWEINSEFSDSLDDLEFELSEFVDMLKNRKLKKEIREELTKIIDSYREY